MRDKTMINRAITLRLLAATALTSALPAFAAEAEAPNPAITQIASADDAEIVVFGKGRTRQVTEVTAEQLRLTTPGTSPLKAIELLPGVNFQSADPFGAYEWSARISIRGFNQNQLGFTLDGVPLGDMSYGNVNGLHISRAITADNIGSTLVSQGAGALSTASTSNLGGTVEFFSRDPAQELGIAANATYGSSDTYRLFGRVDTGDLGGFRAYVSGAYLNAGKWKGDGSQYATQVNAKFVWDASESFTVSGFANYSDRKENDYQDMSLGMIDRLGYDWDNTAPDFLLARQIAQIAANRGEVAGNGQPNTAGTVYPGNITSVDDAYYDAGGLRTDWLAYLKFEARLADNVSASVQPYYHSNKGQGSWFTPYVATPGGSEISFRTTEYGINRYGLTGGLTGEFGRHTLSTGFWFENNDFNHARRFYPVTGTTTASTTALTYQTDPFFTQWYNDFNTSIIQVYLQDSWEITDAITLTAGFKGNSVDLSARRNVPSSLATGTINNSDWFQPQVGGLWKINDNNQLFINYSQNQRAFTAASTGGSPFATTQAGFEAIKGTLRPETSNTLEGGYRFTFGPVTGVAAAYWVDFSNRILATQVGAGIVGNPTVLDNVGDVQSLGFELGLTWQIIKPLTATVSYAYNASTYQDDVVNAAGVVTQAIAGNTVVDSPRNIANFNLVYDDSRFYARGNLNYMSSRYFTYSNDQSVPDRVLLDATIGYRFGGTGPWAGGWAIEGSVTNLTDANYVATVGSNGYGFSGDAQTLLIGAPRQFFITLRKDF
jgi:iron complex outermembrane receptor protein